jgi:hypothetical protein
VSRRINRNTYSGFVADPGWLGGGYVKTGDGEMSLGSILLDAGFSMHEVDEIARVVGVRTWAAA